MLMAMVSLAGLPFTAGFMGKFLVFQVAIDQRQYLLAMLGVLAVACGFYYYLRVVRAMYFQPITTGPDLVGTIPVGLLTRGTIAALIAAILILGVYPAPVLGHFDASPPVVPAPMPVAQTRAQSLNSTFQ